MTAKGELTGRHVLAMLIAFFGVMIIANAAFVAVAVNSFPGVTDEKAYETGINYNDVLAERADQAALGWRAEIVRLETKDGRSVVDLQISNAAGAPLTALRVAGALRRPVHDGADRALDFAPMGRGVYRAETEALDPGLWRLEAQALDPDGARFEVATRVTLP